MTDNWREREREREREMRNGAGEDINHSLGGTRKFKYVEKWIRGSGD